jgi:CRP-like cAMP-binding protein
VSDGGLWKRLGSQLSLVSLRPRLSEDVRIRHIGDEFELVQMGTRRVLPLGEGEVEVVRRFDGEQSVAEIIVATMEGGALEVEPVLSLVGRLTRSELLDQYPPHLYRQIENHLARLVREHGEPDEPSADEDASVDEDSRPEPLRGASGPWRARSPAIEERARFLRGIALFASLDMHSIGALADAAHEETWPAASFIISEGGRADRFFLLRSGEVAVERRTEEGESQGLAKLGPGDWFGEEGLLEHAPRNATVRAGIARPVQLYSFDHDIFDRYIRPHVTAEHGAGLVSRRRAQLEQVPVFRALAAEDLDRLAGVLRDARAAKGTVLFRQGDPADAFYVIVDGAVGVVKDGAPIAKLTNGEFFGETALLFTDTRTATVVATEDSQFWVLDRDAFQRFLRDALLHRRDLMPTVLNRIGSTDPV